MRAGPIDLTPFGPFADALNWLYWLAAIVVLLLVRKKISTRKGKWVGTALVLVVFGTLPAIRLVQSVRAGSQLERAQALFEQRCQSAGEKILRSVEGVEGVVWMKWRDEKINFGDQFKMDDPFGRDCGGEECIANLLRVVGGPQIDSSDAKRHAIGYRFAETTDPRDGKLYRYSGQMKPGSNWTPEAVEKHRREKGQDIPPYAYSFKLDRQPIERYSARYGITWDDISTREDREHWIAGGSLKVIDLQTQEVIAERVGYMMDRGQGDRSGFRQPWGWTRLHGPHCPALVDDRGKPTMIGFTSRFSHAVLPPSKE